MGDGDSIDLYKLLPALYKIKDSEQGYKLKALLDIISNQANIIKRDIDGLWDDFFIETCRPWVIPYIADLVSNNTLHEVAARSRADVAKTIYYRRRKGTLSTLEELAEDITGWGAHAVVLFKLLGWTQNLNHKRFSAAPNPGGQDPNSFSRGGTVNLRDTVALGQIGGPFDIASHSADIRPISSSVGWYNIRKINFFLWRLKSYHITGATPKQSPSHPYGYHFSPLGNPAPLFNRPLITGSGELKAPGQIRHSSFCRSPGDYYGQDRSLSIIKDGSPVPAAAIECTDLSDWDRPAARVEKVRGLLSGEFSSLKLRSPSPELEISIGDKGPHLIKISPLPRTMDEAQMALQSAIRGASTDPEFSEARVIVADDRLLILPGAWGGSISVTASSQSMAENLEDLYLSDSAGARQIYGIVSGDLSIIPDLISPSPEIGAFLGGIFHVIKLAAKPADASKSQRLLQEAINGAQDAPAFVAASIQVFLIGTRLLILSDKEIIFSETSGDKTTFLELGLADKQVAVDVNLGRFTFAEGLEPKSSDIRVDYSYGFSADMGGGIYDRRDTLAGLDGARQITVSRSGQYTSLSDALNGLPSNTSLSAVITIGDSATYDEPGIYIDLRKIKDLVIQAGNNSRPVIRLWDDLMVYGRAGSTLTLNGLLIEGGIYFDENVENVKILHSTLVPGRHLDEDGRPLEPDRPSICSDNERLNLEIDHSITGPIRIPGDAEGKVTVIDSIIDRGRSRVLPALISGKLEPTLSLSSPQPSLNMMIGCEGPHNIGFPKDTQIQNLALDDVRKILEYAIRHASKSPAFSRAKVIVVEDRLVILSGSNSGDISFMKSDDPTFRELHLDESSRNSSAFLSGNLSAFRSLSSDTPAVNLTIGDEGPHRIDLKFKPSILADVRYSLQSGISAVGLEAFSDALVGILEEQVSQGQTVQRLVVLPGKEDLQPGKERAHASFEPVKGDETTVQELSLSEEMPSIAQDDGGCRYGPALSLERTTIFGSVYVKELSTASEVIFVDNVSAERRQEGCVRFSYIPDGSITPKRYHCQPDLARENAGKEKDLKIDHIRPWFTSVHYGEPTYAQLDQGCPEEIKAGAEDGSEMGAFCSLQQPRRVANLRIRLSEYLPFGLEYGFVYVT